MNQTENKIETAPPNYCRCVKLRRLKIQSGQAVPVLLLADGRT